MADSVYNPRLSPFFWSVHLPAYFTKAAAAGFEKRKARYFEESMR